MYLGRISEAASDPRQALEVARQADYPPGEILALAQLSRTAHYAGDLAVALDWARQAQRILASGEYGWTMRFTGPFIIEVLLESGDLTAARRSLADGLTWARQTDNLWAQASFMRLTADLELRAGNLADAGRNLRETIETSLRVGSLARLLPRLDLLGHLCAARGQWTEAVAVWAALQAWLENEGTLDLPLRAQRRQDPLRQAARELGPGRTRTAQERGARYEPASRH